MVRKYQAIDIANYILWYANKKHGGVRVTALKLHKLVYYVAAKFTLANGYPPFDEKIEKWQYGPVTPSVYHTFKGRGYNHLSGPEPQFEISGLSIKLKEFDKNIIAEDHQSLFDSVIDTLVNKSANTLVEMTHSELAWSSNKSLIYSGVRNLEYTDEELREAANHHELGS